MALTKIIIGPNSSGIADVQAGSGSGSSGRPFAASPYFVSTTGNDTTGSGTLANPWATPQHALDVIAKLDGGGNTILLQFADGNYPGPSASDFPTGCPAVILQGNTLDKTLVTFDDTVNGACFQTTQASSYYCFNFITFSPASTNTIAIGLFNIVTTAEVANCRFDSSNTGGSGGDITQVVANCVVHLGGNTYVSGSNEIKGDWNSIFNDQRQNGALFSLDLNLAAVGAVGLNVLYSATGAGSQVVQSGSLTGVGPWSSGIGAVGPYVFFNVGPSNVPAGVSGYITGPTLSPTLLLGPILFGNKFASTPLAGATVSFTFQQTHLILIPAGVLATLTVALPPSPTDGEYVEVRTSQTITALTVNPGSGESIVTGPSTLAAGNMFSAIFHNPTNSWYCAT